MPALTRLTVPALVGLLMCFTLLTAPPVNAGWTVTPRNSKSLSPGSVTDIAELSGVAYLGPTADGLERFVAVQDDGKQMVIFDVAVSANGSLLSATAVRAVPLIFQKLDSEGIAYTGGARNTVFISEEGAPGIHEFDLATGDHLQTLAIPTVFAKRRNNRGFESLTRSVDGRTMWTGNEEALTVDGPASNQTHGTVVRLMRLDDDGKTVTNGPQFAYQVDPVHGAIPDRSGLSDLVLLPDDSLLALERSKADATIPIIQNRIYLVDLAGATDVSAEPFASGLAGQTYTPATKTSLWSGSVTSFVGANLEGLALGPRLANGNWLLLGVVDNGGSGRSPIVAFDLSLTGCSLEGDFNCDGLVNESDYKLWRRLFGSMLAATADGSSSGNGIVDAADYTVWRKNIDTLVGSSTAVDPANCDDVEAADPPAKKLHSIGGKLMKRGIFGRWHRTSGHCDRR
jgi:Esterase-like activity of phytase